MNQIPSFSCAEHDAASGDNGPSADAVIADLIDRRHADRAAALTMFRRIV